MTKSRLAFAIVITIAMMLIQFIFTRVDGLLPTEGVSNLSYQIFWFISTIIETFIALWITKKYLSFNKIGLKTSGLVRSFLYSFVFVLLWRGIVFTSSGTYNPDFLQNINPPLIIFLLLAAFSEELLFRGVILKSWIRSNGFLAGLFISSISFGLIHIFAPFDSNLNSMTGAGATVVVLFTGLIFGPTYSLIAYRTNNIVGLTISHFIFNAFIFINVFTQNAAFPDNMNSIILSVILIPIVYPIIIDTIDRKLFPNDALAKIHWGKYLFGMLGVFILAAAFVV